MSKTDSKSNTVEWRELNWRKIQKAVWKLQKRIYRAYISGDVRKGRRLQKTLINSYYNRLLSVRKVTQENQGKKTAGVDKVKSLTPKQRLELVENLKLGDKSKPIRRVEWLAQFDLELKPSKTRIVHTLNELEDNKPGFDFLGFNIRRYKVGKYQSGKNSKGKLLGFKTIIKPSDKSVKRHYKKLSETIKRLNAAPQIKLIKELNPIIRGWCN